jgi:hypothetical protein
MALKFSATSLDGYTKCSLYFKHRWVDYWKEPVFESSAFGVTLHEAAAKRLMDSLYVPDWTELYGNARLPDPSPELVQITQAYYENWLSHQTDRKPIEVEKDIKLEDTGLGTLVGKIDAIYQEPEGLLIVDHKFLKNVNKKKSNHQMAFYSLLLPEAVKFQYEKVGLEDYQIQETSSISVALRNIEKTIYYINEQRFTANPQQWFIQYCPFMLECGECVK